MVVTKNKDEMKSIFEGKYKEGESFDSYKKVKSIKSAMNHPLVSSIEYCYPNEHWGEMPMFRIYLSDEARYYWVSDEMGDHAFAINAYGDTKKQAIEEVCFLLNHSFKYYEK